MAELKNTCILHEINIKFGESGLFKNEPVMTLVFRSVCKEHNALIYNTFNIPYNSYSVSQCALRFAKNTAQPFSVFTGRSPTVPTDRALAPAAQFGSDRYIRARGAGPPV